MPRESTAPSGRSANSLPGLYGERDALFSDPRRAGRCRAARPAGFPVWMARVPESLEAHIERTCLVNTRTCGLCICAAFLAGAISGRFTIDAQAPQPSPLPQEQVTGIGGVFFTAKNP